MTPCLYWSGPNSYGWGYCSSSCPSDEGYPTTGEGPACEVQTTGLSFPAECEERQARARKKILFLGNSYTYGNSLPKMVKELASAAGRKENRREVRQCNVTSNQGSRPAPKRLHAEV